jgi:[lysine-biosynthesis-protein LysW]---L-2-aminoadipate ligase
MRRRHVLSPGRRRTSHAGRRSQILFLAASRLSPTNARLLDSLRSLKVASEWLPPELASRRVRAGDTVLARLDVLETLDGVEPGIWELRRLESEGIRVLNPAASLLASHDKLATALRLAHAGVPHPRTGQVDGDGTGSLPEPPVVVKPRFGSWGRDVYLCQTRDELNRCLRSMQDRSWFRRHGALVQELVPPAGRDLRAVVAGSAIVGAIERVAAPGEWRTNVALGARRRRVVPSADACELALRAAAAVQGDLVGIDLLPLPGGGHVVLEVNGAVDVTSEYSLDGRDVFEEAATRVVSRLTEPVAVAL